MKTKVVCHFLKFYIFSLVITSYFWLLKLFSSMNFVTISSQQAKMQTSLTQQPGGEAAHAFRDPPIVQSYSGLNP